MPCEDVRGHASVCKKDVQGHARAGEHARSVGLACKAVQECTRQWHARVNEDVQVRVRPGESVRGYARMHENLSGHAGMCENLSGHARTQEICEGM